MAAAGIGGVKDEAKAEKYLIMAIDKGSAAPAAVYYHLAQLHLSAHAPVEPLNVSFTCMHACTHICTNTVIDR